jgi:hypothetical protein
MRDRRRWVAGEKGTPMLRVVTDESTRLPDLTVPIEAHVAFTP